MTQDKLNSERLDRLENHFKVYKEDVSDIKASVSEIKILLGGTELNGRRGFVKLMEINETKINALENDLRDIKHDINTAKYWGKGVTGVIFVTVGLIIKKLMTL